MPSLTASPRVPSRRPGAKSPTPSIALPATDEHVQRIAFLGIEESLLRPDLPPRTAATARARATRSRSLSELPHRYRPARFRLTAAAFDEAEKTDTWFEMLWVDVYAHASRFSARYFGAGGDIAAAEDGEGSLWLFEGKGRRRAGFTRQFLEFASVVARQDGNLGGWDAVLRSAVERSAMVCGILAKALEDGAWDRLLFGAGAEQESLLKELDKGTIRNEGYERTELRTQTINSLLGPAMLPPNFWAEVDTLTTRILALLLPLLDLVDRHFETTRATPLAVIHADLHALVAEAGYLAVCMRRSNSVFRIVWPVLGDPSSATSQDHDPACEAVYKASKVAARAVENVKADKRSVMTGPRIMAKVKHVLWPGLGRYTRVRKGLYEGADEVVIRKAIVGYYCGRASDEADVAESRPRLMEHVKTAAAKRRSRLLRHRLWAWSMILFIVVGAVLLLGFGGPLQDRWPIRNAERLHPESQVWKQRLTYAYVGW